MVGHAWAESFTVSSNFARDNAEIVAVAASEGFITTVTPQGYSRTWRITAAGIAFLEVTQA